jgi:hypothetical protein
MLTCKNCGVQFKRRSNRGREPSYCSGACRNYYRNSRRGQPIPSAIHWLERVLDVHENHLYPHDEAKIQAAIDRLKLMYRQGYR